MSKNVLNGAIGSVDVFNVTAPTREQELKMLSALYEQLLIFERVTIRTNRVNQALYVLIKNLGLDTVERLIRSKYIRFMLWSPTIVMATGHSREDGTVDESSIFGKPPIVAGALTDSDLDPENNILKGLRPFNLPAKRVSKFVRMTRDLYDPIDGMEFSKNSAALVIDAYKNNLLSELGLPFNKEPEQMNLEERGNLLTLGNQVIETAVLSEFDLKSYDNFEHLKICQKNLENIGRGYNVAENTSHLFQLENLPSLQNVYEALGSDFDSVFKIRHLKGAKYYRNWINEIGDYADAKYITSEYLAEIKGTYKYFDSKEGKLLKTATIFVVGTAITSLFANPVASAAAGLATNLLEAYVLDGLWKGHNPSMFINGVGEHINERS